jgi:hypothetical protein
MCAHRASISAYRQFRAPSPSARPVSLGAIWVLAVPKSNPLSLAGYGMGSSSVIDGHVSA